MKPIWVFDLDGTLVDSFPPFFAVMTEIFEANGMTFKPALEYAALTEPLALFFSRQLGKRAVAEAMATLQTKSNESALTTQAFEGVSDMLRRLSESGARIAILTNRDLESAQLILKHSGLGQYTEYCVSGSCVIQRKPHPEGLLRIKDYFAGEIGSVTMVGDHEHDVLVGKKAGARAVRANWHTYWPAEKCPHADHQFHSVREFDDWVQSSISPIAD
jgi:HAD superfamily hydrolase (TIGR01549 family)